MLSNKAHLYENKHFFIEHSIHYRIAGFLFVLPKVPVANLEQLSNEALSGLGPTLQLATKAVQNVLSPVNIYCTKFGESGGTLHFHIFPRTLSLTEVYQHSEGTQESIDGPHLMSWANKQFTGSVEHGNISCTIDLLKDYFRNVG